MTSALPRPVALFMADGGDGSPRPDQPRAAADGWAPPLQDFMGTLEPSDDTADEWVIRNLIPRHEPWLLGGKPKSGKTWLAESLLIHVALGRDWLGFENTLGRPGRALLLTLEDTDVRTRRRIWQLCRGLDLRPDDPLLAENLRVSSLPLALPDDLDRFVEAVTAWCPDVIVADSLTQVMQGDQNRTEDALAFVRAWMAACRQTKTSLGFVHHLNKHGDAVEDLRGSNTFVAAARHIVLITQRQSDKNTGLVKLGGNLDVSRASFVYELQQTTDVETGRKRVGFVDRGDTRADARAATRPVDGKSVELEVLRLARDRGPLTAESLSAIDQARFGKSAKAGKLLTPLRRTGQLDKRGNITAAGLAVLAASGAVA